MVKITQNLLLLLLLLVNNSLHCAEIHIVTENFAPYNYIYNNKLIGKNTELVNLVLKKLNAKSEIKVLPWVRAYNTALQQPNTLIFSIARNSHREHLFHWIGVLSSVDVCLFSLTKRNLGSITTIEQLKDYRVVSQREGHISQQLLKAGFQERKNLFNAISIDHAVQMLLVNRADFIGYPSQVLLYNLEKQGENPSQLLRTNLCLDSTALYLAMNKKTPISTVMAIQQALKQVKSDMNN